MYTDKIPCVVMETGIIFAILKAIIMMITKKLILVSLVIIQSVLVSAQSGKEQQGRVTQLFNFDWKFQAALGQIGRRSARL